MLMSQNTCTLIDMSKGSKSRWVRWGNSQCYGNTRSMFPSLYTDDQGVVVYYREGGWEIRVGG